MDIEVDGGTAPAWLVRAPQESGIWAIMVHGRGASRQECLRAVRTARELGMSSLLITYRNDGLAPSAQDGRYGLGSTEWRDVEAAIGFALEHGAREVVLFGWSMGGAICLQTADLSRYHHLIRAMVLDAPVINWVNVLAHHAELNRIPSAVGRYGQLMMSHKLGRRLTGLAAPVDLKAMDWVSRAVELRTPTLIIHSVDDEYVPYGPSAALAEKNPEMVTFETFDRARHTKEWNVDPERWERLVAAWLGQQIAPRPNPGRQDPELLLPRPRPAAELTHHGSVFDNTACAAHSALLRLLPAGADPCRVRPGEPDQFGGAQLDVQSAPPARDQDGVQAQGAVIHHRGGGLPLSQRRDAAEHVAGAAFGGRRVRHGCLLAAQRGRHRLEVQVPAHGHDADGEPAVDVDHQGFEHPGRVDAEHLRGFQPVAGGRRVMAVGVGDEGNPGGRQCCGGRGSL